MWSVGRGRIHIIERHSSTFVIGLSPSRIYYLYEMVYAKILFLNKSQARACFLTVTAPVIAQPEDGGSGGLLAGNTNGL